jgi:predicted DNA-binding protein
MADQRRQTSFRLPDTDDRLLTILSEKKGINKTSIIILALREMAAREGVPIPTKEEIQAEK